MKLTYFTFISIFWLAVVATFCYLDVGNKPPQEYCNEVHTWYDMTVVFVCILTFWIMGFMVGKDYTKNKI